MFKYDRNMPNAIHFEKTTNLLEVLRNQGIDIECGPGSIEHELNNFKPLFNDISDVSSDKLEEAKVQARAKCIAVAFLSTSDQNIYGKLLEDLESQHTQDYTGVFPTNIVEAYRISTHWRIEPSNFTRMIGPGFNNSVSFNTKGRSGRIGRGCRGGRGGRGRRNGQGDRGGGGERGTQVINCYNYKKLVQTSNMCLDVAATGETNLIFYDNIFFTQKNLVLPMIFRSQIAMDSAG